jgi:hypothetical protein
VFNSVILGPCSAWLLRRLLQTPSAARDEEGASVRGHVQARKVQIAAIQQIKRVAPRPVPEIGFALRLLLLCPLFPLPLTFVSPAIPIQLFSPEGFCTVARLHLCCVIQGKAHLSRTWNSADKLRISKAFS